MTQDPSADGHLDVQALANLDEGLVEGPEAAVMADHLASCDTCRTRRAGTSAAGTTVVPPSSRRRRWIHHPTLPGLAAGFVTLALLGAVVVGVLASNHARTSPRSAPPVSPTTSGTPVLQYPILTTGRNYTKPTISTLVERLLAQARARTAAATPTGGPVPGVAGGLAPLYGSRSALNDCVAALSAGGPPQSPLAVDFARYAGQPAVVVVLPGILSTNVDAWVVSPACDRRDEHLLLYASLPRHG